MLVVTEGDELITRQTDHGILAGITRQTLKKLCDSLQLKIRRAGRSAWPRPAGEGSFHQQRHVVRHARGEDRRCAGADGKVGPVARACARNMCGSHRLESRLRESSEPLKRPRAILFDWDNTLVDTWPTIVECYRDTFSALGRTPWTDEEVRTRAHGPCARSFRFFSASMPYAPRPCSTKPSTVSICSGCSL